MRGLVGRGLVMPGLVLVKESAGTKSLRFFFKYLLSINFVGTNA